MASDKSVTDARASETVQRGAIWDLPLRLFHWALVLLIIGAWYTAENGLLDQHQAIGMAILILLIFRFIWGFVGGSTARFSQFFSGPARLAAYMKDRTNWRAIGHNPLGSLSVFALLGAVAMQVGLGLFSTDNDGLMEGPLAGLVSLNISETLTNLHESWFNILLGLIGLHIAAILIYVLKGKNLIGPMVTGNGDVPAGAKPLQKSRWWAALLALFVAWAIAGVVWSMGS